MRSLLLRRHPSPQRVRPQQNLKGPHSLLGEFGHSGLAGVNRGSWELRLEANLGFCRRRVVSRFSQAEPKRQGRAMPLRKRSLTQLPKDSQGGLHSPQVPEIEQIHHERHVAHHASTRLVEIDVDTYVLVPRIEMEKEVRTAGRFSIPPTLELMAGGLLQTRQLPPGRQNTVLHSLDERLERKNGTRDRIRHDWLTPFQRPA
jgi:hypothetical protein